MRKLMIVCASVLALSGGAAAFAAAHKLPAYVTAALADKSRPKADTDVDAARKPGELIAFAGVKPGQTVVDMLPGGGYFTRLFSDVVGPKGHVYAYVPLEMNAFSKGRALTRANDVAKASKNVTVAAGPINEFAVPKKADVVWITLNYHDLHDPFMGPADLAKVNKAVWKALKPGGVYLIVDHSAAKGSGLRDTDTLHRIDAETVKSEVTAAGFKLAGSSDMLANPEDDRSKKVFDPSIRRHTDQFVFKFVKPRR